MLGEMYSAAFTGAMFNWICSPAVTELETIVLDWLARMFALPDVYLSTGPTRGGGVIHGTASEAVVTVMVAARDKFLREATSHLASNDNNAMHNTLDHDTAEFDDPRQEAMAHLRSRLVALGSAAAHSSTHKAALIAGVRFVTVPTVRAPDGGGYVMTADALRKTIAHCHARGWLPFYLTATIGTTDTAAVDDLAGIAALLDGDNEENRLADEAFLKAVRRFTPMENHPSGFPARPRIWVHIDAAYAGAALVCPEYQNLTKPLASPSFKSYNTNLHKWLLTNFDCSCLWVRDRSDLIEALSTSPAYLRNPYTDAGLVTDYRDWQIPLGRRFRSLKAWFVLRTYGVSGLREHIRSGIRLCDGLAGMLRERKDLFEIVTGPNFALLVFRVARPAIAKEAAADEDEERWRNETTKAVYEKINREGKIYLTSTVLDGKYCIRAQTGQPNMTEEHVRKAFSVILDAAEGFIRAQEEARR